jgi:glucose-1-phosphate thymidylyltransferase
MQELQPRSREVTGIVLAGGRGTRLHPLTAETSKHLLPIGGKPMVVRAIEQLLAADVKDILVVIDPRYASQYMQLLQDGSQLGANSLAYVWQDPEGKGLPTAINQTAPHIRDERIVVACGDVLIEEGIKGPVSDFMHQQDGARLTATHVVDSAGYSLLQVEGDHVLNIYNKDDTRHASGPIDLGIYMYTPEVFEHIAELTASSRGETEIWDLNQQYVNAHTLGYTAVSGWWSDTGGGIQTYGEADAHYAGK